jgi:hypothetical protein
MGSSGWICTVNSRGDGGEGDKAKEEDNKEKRREEEKRK